MKKYDIAITHIGDEDYYIGKCEFENEKEINDFLIYYYGEIDKATNLIDHFGSYERDWDIVFYESDLNCHYDYYDHERQELLDELKSRWNWKSARIEMDLYNNQWHLKRDIERRQEIVKELERLQNELKLIEESIPEYESEIKRLEGLQQLNQEAE